MHVNPHAHGTWLRLMPHASCLTAWLKAHGSWLMDPSSLLVVHTTWFCFCFSSEHIKCVRGFRSIYIYMFACLSYINLNNNTIVSAHSTYLLECLNISMNFTSFTRCKISTAFEFQITIISQSYVLNSKTCLALHHR